MAKGIRCQVVLRRRRNERWTPFIRLTRSGFSTFNANSTRGVGPPPMMRGGTCGNGSPNHRTSALHGDVSRAIAARARRAGTNPTTRIRHGRARCITKGARRVRERGLGKPAGETPTAAPRPHVRYGTKRTGLRWGLVHEGSFNKTDPLRDLYQGLHGAWPRPGVQLAGRPI